MTESLIPPLVSEGQVQAHVNGCLGLITLSRPEALNALTLPMVRDITLVLQHWEKHPTIQAVAFLGANREGKAPAFCAGGDIRFFYRAALDKDEGLWDFFAEEYALVHLIHRYTKPTIALMDGIVMGGGMGLTQGAKLRVVNELSRLAMPECRIGLFPDVGGGWFLGQCPGATGEWLALTGQALGAGDAINLGLADVFVPRHGWLELLGALRTEPQPSAEHVVATVMERAELAPEPHCLPFRGVIDECFAQSELSAVYEALTAARQRGAHFARWADETLDQMRHSSPTALARSLELVRRGRGLGLADELRLELNLVHACFEPAWRNEPTDTVEGIRAKVIHKGSEPNWRPKSAAELTPEWVEDGFRARWEPAAHPLRTLGN